MATHKELQQRVGVYSQARLRNPHIIELKDLVLPRLSIYTEIADPFSEAEPSDSGIFVKNNNVMVFNTKTYGNAAPRGNPVYVKTGFDRALMEYKKSGISFEFALDADKIKRAPQNTLVFINNSLLNSAYRYGSSANTPYNKIMNQIETMTYSINEAVTYSRHIYIEIPIPPLIPSYTVISNLYSKKDYRVVDALKDKNSIVIFELIKWVGGDESAFSNLALDKMEDVSFLFSFGDKFSLFKVVDLYTINSDNKPILLKSEGSIKIGNKTLAQKAFLLYLHRVASSSDKISEEKKTSASDRLTKEEIEKELEDETIKNEKEIEEITEIELTEITPVMSKLLNEESNGYLEEVDTFTDALLEFNTITDTHHHKLKDALLEQAKNKIPESFNVTIEDMTLSDEEIVTPYTDVVEDKSYFRNTLVTMRKKYQKEIYSKHMLAVFYNFQKAGVIVKNVETITEDNILGGQTDHVATVVTPDGKQSTIKVRMPNFKEDGTFKMSGTHYNSRMQRQDIPIKKIRPNIVGLSSYYGKLTVTKARYKIGDASHYIYSQLKSLTEIENSDISLLVYGNSDIYDVHLPADYTLVGRHISSIKKGNNYFNFNYKKRKQILLNNDTLSTIEKPGYIICGADGAGHYFLMDINSKLFISSPKGLTETKSLIEHLDIDLSNTPNEYATVKVLREEIPIAVVLTHYMGIDALIKMLKAEYTVCGSREKYIPQLDEYILTFEDKKVVFKKTNRLSVMILSSFTMYAKHIKGMTFSSLNTKSTTAGLMYSAGCSRRHIIEIGLLFSLYVDPITKNILEKLKEPTTFIGLLIRSGELLVSGYAVDPNNIQGMLLRGNEKLSGMVYKELVMSYKSHLLMGVPFRTRLLSAWGKIGEDSNTAPIDDINPFSTIRIMEDVSYTGEGGRNKQTMVESTRIYHENDVGIISENVRDKSDVGVTAYTTAVPMLKNLYGVPDIIDFKDIPESSIFSTTVLQAPFSLSDAGKRANMTSVQSGHLVPLMNAIVLPIRTLNDLSMIYRLPDKYVYTAKKDGVVVDKTDESLYVKYNDKIEETIPLNRWMTKEEAERTYMHQKTSTLSKGDRFKVGQVLSYDGVFFEPDFFDSTRVAIKTGVLLTTLLSESQETFEDSSSISKQASKKLESEFIHIKSYSATIDKAVDIFIKIGDMVTSTQKIITSYPRISEGFDDKLSKQSQEILSDIKRSTAMAGVNGEVVDIKVYYNCELSDMHQSLKKIVMASDKRIAYENNNSKFNGKVDQTYSIRGVSMLEGNIEIKIYIKVVSDMLFGNKGVFGNQLKTTIGRVFRDENRTIDGRLIEATTSSRSLAARIVYSPYIYGTTYNVLKYGTIKICNDYFNRKK